MSDCGIALVLARRRAMANFTVAEVEFCISRTCFTNANRSVGQLADLLRSIAQTQTLELTHKHIQLHTNLLLTACVMIQTFKRAKLYC